MMTNRERMLAILAGKSPDQVPWIPRMKLWHNGQKANGTLPARFKNKSLREVEQALRLGNPARDGRVYRTQYRGMEVRSHEEGHSTIT
ncbi:MAG: hypothetical protein Q8O40_09545, partial [Chloroflexota bacterium]|nr:hypothetical protein [Chloroflexota bacterium]